MSETLLEKVKVDIGLVPQTLNNSNATGAWYHMRDYRRAVAMLTAGATAATKTTKVEFLQATDAAGSGSKALSPAVETTVTANTGVVEATLTLGTVLAADAITINGVTFTAHATVTTVANREFSISGNDAADAAELAACINDATYGVSGVTASVNSNVITLKATRPGEQLLTISAAASTITVATTKHIAFADCSHFDLDHEGSFQWLACKVTTTGNTPVSVSLARYEPREGV